MNGVLIMLASYNGEKYIRKQIESIRRQTYSDWHLLIQDDGSTDATIDIVKEYCLKDNRIELIFNTENIHGAYINFHVLANKARCMQPYAYYMFCDQDDVWKKDKIAAFVYYMDNKSHEDIPMLCYADMGTIDGDDNKLTSSVDAIRGLAYVNAYRVFFAHRIAGCNMMMNRKLFVIVPDVDINKPYAITLSHDNYFAKFAAVYGHIFYINQVTMQYRRHGNNCTKSGSFANNSVKRITSRILDLDGLGKDHVGTYNQSLVSIQIMREHHFPDMPIMKEVEDVIYKGGLKGCIFLRKHHVSWGNQMNDVSRYLTMFLKTYKKYIVSR